jgi:diguanylate cyclase (GGDEF)-like protein
MLSYVSSHQYLADFIYGLAFFIMGWSILLKSSSQQNQFLLSLNHLSFFGILQAMVKWLDMILSWEAPHLDPAYLNGIIIFQHIVLGTSFYFLELSGFNLLGIRLKHKVPVLISIWAALMLIPILLLLGPGITPVSDPAQMELVDVLARNLIGFPAGILFMVGILRQLPVFSYYYDRAIVRHAIGLAVSVGLLAIMSGLVTPAAESGLASILNEDTFSKFLGFSVYFVRAILAALCMVFAVQMLDMFKLDEQYRDSKTQLASTPLIYKFIQSCVKRSEPFSVLFLDLDLFKQINDQYGHLFGDQVLLNVAQTLTQNTRAIDCVGRFGGEEFVIILPGSKLPEAMQAAERLRVQIADNRQILPGGAAAIQVTISIGVAEWDRKSGIDDLLEKADNAMYAAKSAGRNRVQKYQPAAA